MKTQKTLSTVQAIRRCAASLHTELAVLEIALDSSAPCLTPLQSCDVRLEIASAKTRIDRVTQSISKLEIRS